MTKIMCPTCHKHRAIMHHTYGPTACKWCIKRSEENPIIGGGYSSKRDDIVAIVKDQAGQSFGYTTSGTLVPEKHTRYDTKKDKHGWFATDRKVKGYQQGYKPKDWQK